MRRDAIARPTEREAPFRLQRQRQRRARGVGAGWSEEGREREGKREREVQQEGKRRRKSCQVGERGRGGESGTRVVVVVDAPWLLVLEQFRLVRDEPDSSERLDFVCEIGGRTRDEHEILKRSSKDTRIKAMRGKQKQVSGGRTVAGARNRLAHRACSAVQCVCVCKSLTFGISSC